MEKSIKIPDFERQEKERKYGIHYKWVALSNTTLGALLASIDSSILIISLPAVFNGLGVNPLSAGNLILLLWLLLGYTIVSSVTVVTIGRLSDMFGRVRLYNIGFAIFSFASILLYASSYLVQGTAGIISLTILRLIQGLGSGFLFANSAAILTDAFPENERGKALGFNQIAAIGGNLAGLLIGGILAAIDWHLIFLISVPIGIAGAIWAYVALHELATIRKNQKLDILGNITFAVSLTTILLSLSYGILPYGNSSTGWTNPWVQAGFGLGIALLFLFAFIETKAKDPMFHLWLFRIRAFAAGNLSMLLAGLARGGLQFMLIIWLQGIWLPLHGVSFIDTPFQAAIDMIPLVAGFLISGPISGYLSDRYGARLFSTMGMLLNVIGFLILASMPADFNYTPFAITIFFLGVGQGMFSAPNTAAVMNSVPPEYRGVTSGMRATLLNVSFMFSLAIFFSLLIIGVSSSLPGALYDGLISQNVSSATALQISRLPPSSTLFAALLGYNPMKTLLPPDVLNSLPPKNANAILGTSFFPNMISSSFMSGMRIVMYSGALLALFAAIFSALRGRRYVHEMRNS
ncbi:Putative multidrug resistance protein MdtD [uncultured archaeon]|nr:Putative multidrug resistance protein MdtD [uncultured archaeon]